MSTIGEQLREARQALGLSIQDVEQATRIRRAFLVALEEDRLQDLPDPAYARGFVRNYARHVGLDAQPLVAAFEHQVASPDVDIPVMLDEPLFARARRGLKAALWVLVIGLLVVALGWVAYGYYYLNELPWPLTEFEGLAANLATPTATHTAAPAAVAATNTPQPEAPTMTPQPSLTPTQTIEPTAETAASPETAETAQPTATNALPADIPASEGLPEPTAFTVRIVSSGYTWLQAFRDDQEVFVGYLDEGEEQSWTADQTVELRVGNAAVVRVEVNGNDMGPLGGEDEAVTLLYTPDSLP